jgi:hypothetical protein
MGIPRTAAVGTKCQTVVQGPHGVHFYKDFVMKTEEDEAFDEIARKQGMWGGGFQAKRAMAADRDALFEKFELAQPAQEPVAYVTGMSFGRFIVEPLNPAMVLPVGMALYSLPLGNK